MTPLNTFLFAALVATLMIIAYHHLGYPILLRRLARSRARHGGNSIGTTNSANSRADTGQAMPRVTIIVPAYNEQHFIEAKITNLVALDYPRDRLQIVIALDGCTDDTYKIATSTVNQLAAGDLVEVVVYNRNVGKIAVLNEQIAKAKCDLVVLSDASAVVDRSALRVAATHFADDSVGVVCATYRLAEAGSEGERAYWDYQTEIKAQEALIAAPMGAHGAFYLFRRALWRTLPADTINDDFVIPMRIVGAGYRAVYDKSIVATELERSHAGQEFGRRIRIGAGNLQQTVRLATLASPRNAWLAFLFLSGKGLRPIIPFLVLLAVGLTLTLAVREGSSFQLLLAAELSAFVLATFVVFNRELAVPKPIAWLGYLIEGHTASFLGAVQFLTGIGKPGWKNGLLEDRIRADAQTYIPPQVEAGKRLFDICGALAGIVLLALVAIPIAIFIKLESPGPVIYRQRRVGRATPTATYVFDLMKFRTMRNDAETKCGPVWAVKGDPRITRTGDFLRKTRLDELPQLINVLKGDMSLVGPRPERPIFFQMLDEKIPFYGERTFGLRPGITGLAQVNQEYDSSIEDVKNKILYDHAYAAQLTSLSHWFWADVGILLKTIGVMFGRKGR